ncbi:MAG: alpha/beta hydrolase [Hyphomonas sp.]|uniref:alpha/beta hydrolase n=1 Tax=Hyphomonas sp. TaxID=87 RepID=UPI0034A0025E
MSSRHLVEPDLIAFLDAMPTMTLSADNLAAIRAARDGMLSQLPPFPETVSVEERHIPGPAGAPTVRTKIYLRKEGAALRPAILHLHGGGYIMGNPEFMGPQCALWADAFDAVVVGAAYRLGPETRYPGNVEDAYAALAWMIAHASELGINTARIAVAGESAGGGLAASLALLVRDRGEYNFCHQQLIFPMIDDRTAVRTDLSPIYGEFVWNNGSNHFGWTSLLGQPPGSEGVSPYAAAARAESLKGLPPVFMATGALDLFTEENLDYAKRLMADGVPVELHVYPGAPHAFMQVPGARVTRAYARDAMAALGRALGAERA